MSDTHISFRVGFKQLRDAQYFARAIFARVEGRPRVIYTQEVGLVEDEEE